MKGEVVALRDHYVYRIFISAYSWNGILIKPWEYRGRQAEADPIRAKEIGSLPKEMEGEPKEIVNQPKEIGSQQKEMEGEPKEIVN